MRSGRDGERWVKVRREWAEVRSGRAGARSEGMGWGEILQE